MDSGQVGTGERKGRVGRKFGVRDAVGARLGGVRP